ncbi:HMA domain-containing protein [Cephalotus follicularis]|uniref:HMA domain-containing protein n=1 Tax=Cephalotus follicularis TaxID=3775 RepID=A0A1Q3D1G9_CEPFO|nr:HMA domain-containing protein [Cephalotus follicularis]
MLRVYMHCEGCSHKVFSCLKNFDGVEEVKVDKANNKVTVKGQRADPVKVLERIRKKYSRNAELLSPKPNKEEKKPEKREEPKVRTVVLKMHMHCQGCARDIKRDIERMKGVVTVEPDTRTSQVTVRGSFDTPKLVENIAKRLGKYAEVLKQVLDQQEQKGKDRDNKKDNKEEEKIVFYYPSLNSMHHVYPHQLFSEENVFSCSIM